MITLISRETQQPASGASAASYARWDDIPQAYRETYARQGEEPTRGQSDLYCWSGEDELMVPEHPSVVCLCGSTRFAARMNEVGIAETLAGRIVVRPEVVAYDGNNDPQKVNPAQKRMLDELHRRKIDLSDEILVVNVGGYVGDSTRGEIEYARSKGKPIRWDEPDKALEVQAS